MAIRGLVTRGYGNGVFNGNIAGLVYRGYVAAVSFIPTTSILLRGVQGVDWHVHDASNAALVKIISDISEEVAYSELTDVASGTITYKGTAKAGTLTSESQWRVLRETISGNVTSTEYASGNGNFDNVWDDRAGLTYI